MEQNWISKWSVYFVRNRHRRLLHKFVQVMACIVVFCTTYALILPAITMEQNTFCGLEEHTHTEACYAQEIQKNLICTAETLSLHVHGTGCYDAEGGLVCGQADYVVHCHDASCFDEENNLVCTLPERSAHVHGDGCYAAAEEIPHVHQESCLAKEKGNLICTTEEYNGHSHSADCYVPGEELDCTLTENHLHGDDCYTYPLICTLSTDPHVHDSSCYISGDLQCTTPEGHTHGESCVESRHTCVSTEEDHICDSGCYTTVSICSIPEGHIHSAGCYASVLNCGKNEGQAHEHGDGCYSTEPKLNCTLTENHSHQEDCYKKVLNCDIPEDPGHSHGDDCYDWETVTICGYEEGEMETLDPELVCTEPAAVVHVHGEGCFEEVQAPAQPICGNTAEDHVHTSECYTIICGLENHVHELPCYSDPEADVETREIWEATFAHVELTGDRYKDLVAIAETQLGYTESTRNYAVWEDDTVHGYTRYGAWYGVPYGDWCGMFVSFCLRYADVDNIPINYGVRPWIEDLTELGLYHRAEDYTPKSGDIIFYDWEGDGLSDHVGIVAEVQEATEHTGARIKAIEGNSSNCVQYVYYDPDDPVILGYSELPEKEEEEEQITYYCGLEEHTHSEECHDAEGNLICGKDEHAHSQDCTKEPVTYCCGLEEHAHSEECHDAEGNLICGKDEHTHSEDCTKEPLTYYCGLEPHKHDTQCYDPETGVLICKLTEHTHTEACTLASVEYFCGREEHTHTDACYDAEGNLICTLEEHIHDETCLIRPPEYLCGLTAHIHDDSCYDSEGNLICELEEHIHTALCLGYTCGMEEHSHTEDCFDEEGNLICSLSEHIHNSICDNYVCGRIPHMHTESCYDSTGSLICGMEEHVHTVDCMEFKLSHSDNVIQVDVTITGTEFLPEDLTLKVEPITEESHPHVYGSMQAALSQQMSSNTQYVGDACIFDMQLLQGDTVFELPEGASVSVSAAFVTPAFTPSAVSDAVGMYAFTLTADESEENVPEARSVPNGEIGDGNSADPVVNYTSAPAALSLVSADASAGENTADSSGEVEAAPAVSSYLASAPQEEDIYNANEGITGVSFRSEGISAFAVALASEIQNGTFWTRVTSKDQLTADGTYMIVSAEGNYALRGDNSNTYTAVRLQTVKGNTDYYTIDLSDSEESVDSGLYWTISPSGSSYTIRNMGTSRYIYLASVNEGSTWWPNYVNYVIHTSSRSLSLNYKSPENCWTIANGSTYLLNDGEGSFSFGSSGVSGYYGPYYYRRDMLIFKMSDVTSLSVPSDVTQSSGSIVSGRDETKPDYGDFVTPSGEKTGDTSVVDLNNPDSVVSGKYYSDPSTSQIEKNFRKENVLDYYDNDGKVMTDKSVIYGDDDYGAFQTYDPNTFGVTLSALGQSYKVAEEDIVKTPVDVVFILDVSGSMNSNDDTGSTATRAVDMTKAVNTAMDYILDVNNHPANRVGIALYSPGSWQLLPLGRYKANVGSDGVSEYLTCAAKSYTHGPTNVALNNRYFITGSNSLTTEDGSRSYAGVGSSFSQGIGTYTQAGIATGGQIFANVGSDTTYTATFGSEEEGTLREYEVKRQPVFILLSDGEPTHSTNIYMDPLNGPHYGDGNGGTDNALGIHGYNTILTANYFKRMVGIQYNNPALFYSVGMGIASSGDGPQVDGSSTGDDYKRFVLNPQSGNLGDLDSSTRNQANTTQQLKALLQGSFGSQAIKVRSDWPEVELGVPHVYAPALQGNPYAGNYNYADGAYFGALGQTELEDIFKQVIDTGLKTFPYGFILYQDSSVKIDDPIGDGMEVKGDPVLRFFGKNYSHTGKSVSGNQTIYTYAYTVVDPYAIPRREYDISRIQAVVTAESDGTQNVTLYIPDNTLPTYVPSENAALYKYGEDVTDSMFYYEALPVRLIYQVGLTEASENAVLDLNRTGGQLTFYTNQWQGVNARTDLTPSEDNPFYHSEPAFYQPHSNTKTDNTTDTSDYSVECHWDDSGIGHVYHDHGNNGKLVFEAESVDIPVEKKWEETYGVLDLPEVSMTLYRVTPDSEDPQLIRTVETVKTIVLNSSSGTPWTGIFEDVLIPSGSWYYAIAESSVPEGFRVGYVGETISIAPDNGKPVTAVKVQFTDKTAELTTVTNTFTQWYELPKTGGAGTTPYTAGGLLLTAAALLLLYNNIIKRRKEDLKSS